MKILHLCHLYEPSVGGCQIYMKELSEKLVEFGENVTVFTPTALNDLDFVHPGPELGKLPPFETINGVDVQRFPIAYKLRSLLFQQLPEIRGGYRLVNLVFHNAIETLKMGPVIPDVIFEIVKRKPDVLVSLSAYYANSYFCYLAKKILNIPFVIIPSLRTEPTWVDSPMVNRILKSADLLIAFTEFEKKILIDKGIEPQRVIVVGNAINPSRFLVADGQQIRKKYQLNSDPVVAFIGRKMKGKGVEVLIDAMKIVWKRNKNTKLVLAGVNEPHHEFELRQHFESLSEENKKKVIEINGFSDEEKPGIFAACDIFAMPSGIDSFGIVYLEAWATGKPIIACKNRPQATFIEPGQDGCLVDYNNADELAEVITQLLKDREQGVRMGQRGKQKVLDHYNWDVIARIIQEAYRGLVRSDADKDNTVGAEVLAIQ